MLTTKRQMQTKQEVIQNLRSVQTSKLYVCDLHQSKDKSHVIKYIDSKLKSGTVSVIVLHTAN